MFSMITKSDYGFCINCQTIFDLWKYNKLEDSGHEGHKTRPITDEEFKQAVEQCREMGCFEEHHFDEDHHHYEAKPASAHHHLVCLGCGRVIEFDYDLARHLEKNVPETREFEITETELRINGYCSEFSITQIIFK